MPFSKAAIRRFMTDGDAWFEFFLADHMRITVGQLRKQISEREIREWQAWYRLKWDREARAKR